MNPMKTTHEFKLKTYVNAFLLAILLLGVSSLKAQESSSQPLHVYPTFGIGIGFFYPQDVNEYIENEITSEYTDTYNTEMYAYYEIKAGVTFRLKKVDFSAILEYDIAPKYMVVNGGSSSSVFYSFSRFAPELSANYYIPTSSSGKQALFIGGAVNYSFMTFKSFSASAPGFKVQLGYSLQVGKMNMQPYLAFRYATATDKSDDYAYPDFELNYTGGQIGINFSFHKTISYK
jgi:hypothetical protein